MSSTLVLVPVLVHTKCKILTNQKRCQESFLPVFLTNQKRRHVSPACLPLDQSGAGSHSANQDRGATSSTNRCICICIMQVGFPIHDDLGRPGSADSWMLQTAETTSSVLNDHPWIHSSAYYSKLPTFCPRHMGSIHPPAHPSIRPSIHPSTHTYPRSIL